MCALFTTPPEPNLPILYFRRKSFHTNTHHRCQSTCTTFCFFQLLYYSSFRNNHNTRILLYKTRTMLTRTKDFALESPCALAVKKTWYILAVPIPCPFISSRVTEPAAAAKDAEQDVVVAFVRDHRSPRSADSVPVGTILLSTVISTTISPEKHRPYDLPNPTFANNTTNGIPIIPPPLVARSGRKSKVTPQFMEGMHNNQSLCTWKPFVVPGYDNVARENKALFSAPNGHMEVPFSQGAKKTRGNGTVANLLEESKHDNAIPELLFREPPRVVSRFENVHVPYEVIEKYHHHLGDSSASRTFLTLSVKKRGKSTQPHSVFGSNATEKSLSVGVGASLLWEVSSTWSCDDGTVDDRPKDWYEPLDENKLVLEGPTNNNIPISQIDWRIPTSISRLRVQPDNLKPLLRQHMPQAPPSSNATIQTYLDIFPVEDNRQAWDDDIQRRYGAIQPGMLLFVIVVCMIYRCSQNSTKARIDKPQSLTDASSTQEASSESAKKADNLLPAIEQVQQETELSRCLVLSKEESSLVDDTLVLLALEEIQSLLALSKSQSQEELKVAHPDLCKRVVEQWTPLLPVQDTSSNEAHRTSCHVLIRKLTRLAAFDGPVAHCLDLLEEWMVPVFISNGINFKEQSTLRAMIEDLCSFLQIKHDLPSSAVITLLPFVIANTSMNDVCCERKLGQRVSSAVESLGDVYE